jgi:hypothetical protein
MPIRLALTALGAAAVVAVVGGCSAKSAPGSPSADGGNTVSSTSVSPPGAAPHVANPLDTTKFQAQPCQTLNAAQVQSLGFPGATNKPDTANPLGPYCQWDSSQVAGTLAVTLVTANKQGLGSLYRKKKDLAVFQELPPVDGYPAVIYGQADLRSRGTCVVSVGASDTLDFDVAVGAPDGPMKSDPCGIAQRAAALMVENIKGG